MQRRRLVTVLVIILVVAVVGVGADAWRRHVIAVQREKVRGDVEQLLARGQLREARAGVQLFLRQNPRGLSAAEQAAWTQLDVRVSEALRDVARLIWLFDRQPRCLDGHEEAALTVLRALGTAGANPAAERLRAQWHGREQRPALWLAYDADRLAAAGRRDEAIALLEGRTFAGAEDCARLMRLALLRRDDPAQAAALLQRAFAADPRNPDLRTFRGQVLEAAGQAGLARVEYVAALVAKPGDPLLRDQLAEFYLRTARIAEAVQTWRDGLGPEMPDFLWFKCLFWERVALPRPGSAPACPPGPLEPAVNFLRQLPPSRFFDATAFASVRDGARLAASRQELFWLQLLQDLADGREAAALERLETRGYRGSAWDPELESVLRIVLKFRLQQRTPAPGDFAVQPRADSRHFLFDQVERWARSAVEDVATLPPETREFLSGPRAFAGILLAAGWIEAGLRLAGEQPADPGAPEWYRYAVAQGLRLNRGPAEALAFLRDQPPSPLLDLVRGELLFALRRAPEAEQVMRPLAGRADDTGLRAAWLLASHELGRGDAATCEALVAGNARLAASPRGAELRARMALARRDLAAATRHYEAAADDSLEAGIFLSRLAFQRRDWAAARRLTEALVARYPDELTLQANLEAIARAEKGGAP